MSDANKMLNIRSGRVAETREKLRILSKATGLYQAAALELALDMAIALLNKKRKDY